MSKAVFHLQGGLGDYYYFLAMLPHIRDSMGAEIGGEEAWLDSVYFAMDGFEKQRSAVCSVLNRHLPNWKPMPVEACSFMLHDPEWVRDPDMEKVKRDFLFHRLEKSKSFMRGRLQPGDVFVGTIVGITYEWVNGENRVIDVPVSPVNLRSARPACWNKVDDHVVVHVRVKDNSTQAWFFDRLLDWLSVREIPTVLVGVPEELTIQHRSSVVDARHLPFEEQVWLVENCGYMVGGGSMFSYHRTLLDKPTIAQVAGSMGGVKVCFHRQATTNPKNVFLDSDTPQYSNVVTKLGEWLCIA